MISIILQISSFDNVSHNAKPDELILDYLYFMKTVDSVFLTISRSRSSRRFWNLYLLPSRYIFGNQSK